MNCSVTVNFSDCQNPAVHYTYHRFFIDALRTLPGLTICFEPYEARWLASMHQAGMRGTYKLWTTMAEYRQQHKAIGADRCVRYTFRFADQSEVRVVIDPSDARFVRYPGALEWCDVYFKTNFWPSIGYPAKVEPMANCNGMLHRNAIAELRKLRHAPATRDLVYWTKIWEPRSELRTAHYSEEARRTILEHQLRLFETLAAVECRSDLIAIVPADLTTLTSGEVTARLESAGVRCQQGWGRIDTAGLWRGLAGARIVFLRPGNHLCVSWRMYDLLAMGACVLHDGAPYASWHAPLKSGVHFLDGQCALAADHKPPEPCRYAALGTQIGHLLKDNQRLQDVRTAAAAYFDTHATHRAIGEHIFDTLQPLRLQPGLLTY